MAQVEGFTTSLGARLRNIVILNDVPTIALLSRRHCDPNKFYFFEQVGPKVAVIVIGGID